MPHTHTTPIWTDSNQPHHLTITITDEGAIFDITAGDNVTATTALTFDEWADLITTLDPLATPPAE